MVGLSIPGLAANMWGIHGAYWDTSDADDAFGAGGKFSFELVPGARLDFRATYFDDLNTGGSGVEVDLEVVPLEGGISLAYPVSDRVELFAGGGIGYYFLNADVSEPGGQEVTGGDPGDDVGFYIAGGLEWAIVSSQVAYGETWAGLYAEVLYRSADAAEVKVSSGDQVSYGNADLGGLGVNLGLMVRW
jgi:hypothetical protein